MIIWADLTEEQRRFAKHAGEAFVQACPGAGKTCSIVARLSKIAETLPPRKGVALLSFTNSAVEEFTQRCGASGLGEFLRLPSFVGTFDAFVRHFIVLPGGMAARSTRPIIVDSWKNFGVEIRLSGQYAFAVGVSLDRFDPITNAINPDQIGHLGLQSHVRQNKARYEQVARYRRQQLHSIGYLSAGDARIEAGKIIAAPARGAALGRAIAARFHEVIVDEGQDCNPNDLGILAWLRQHGLRVTIVCDVDQAIYNFRHGNPGDLRALSALYPSDGRLPLSGNFRSSPAICQLAATLRNAGNVDSSVGESATITHGVEVLVYGGRGVGADIGRIFLARLTALGLAPSDSIVLAHSRSVAERAAGVDSVKVAGTSRVEAMAQVVGAFWSGATSSRARENALRSVEELLLDFMKKREPGEHLTKSIERTGIDRRSLRRQALAVLMNVPKSCEDTDNSRSSWITILQTIVGQLGLDLPRGQTVRGFFRSPPSGAWSSHLKGKVSHGLASSTIHEAKGREYDCVCVVIPPDRAPDNYTSALFEAWENRNDEEAKRVIYVGVTRARKLSVLAVPAAFADRCIALLTAANVSHVRRDITIPAATRNSSVGQRTGPSPAGRARKVRA